MATKTKRRGLGKDLSALLNQDLFSGKQAHTSEETSSAPLSKEGELRVIPIDLVDRSPYQPRRVMEPQALQELSDSIKTQGLIQPIAVRPLEGGRYELIAGERRWRASQMAELGDIPAVVRELDDRSAMAMALIENIQRQDLNPIEEALAMQRLSQELDLTHEQVAHAVGKSRTSVTNLLRLLTLRQEVKTLIEHGDLEMGHARALIALDADLQLKVAKEIVNKGLSVREAERTIRQLKAASRGQSEALPIDADIAALERKISDALNAAVRLQHKPNGKGQLVIHYHSLDALDGILKHLGAEA